MTGEKVQSTDLNEVLSLTPLLHLIPKQSIASLITQGPIDTVCDDIDISGKNPKSEANIMRRALNKDPEYFKDVMQYLSEEFKNFEDAELEDLQFKKPVLHYDNDSSIENINLPPLERKLFDETKEIEDSCIKELKVSFDPAEFDGSRLSIRKNYDVEEPSSLINHNRVYHKKFKKEYNNMVVMKNKSKAEASNIDQYNNNIKRPVSESGSSTPEPKRHQKTVYFDSSDLVNKAYFELNSLLKEIDKAESENIEDQHIWTIFADSKILSTKVLVKLLDHLHRIVSTNIIKDVCIDEILKIQQYCLLSIREGTLRDWSEIIELINRNEDLESQVSELNIILEQAYNALNAAKIMLEIMTGKRADKRLHLDDYLKSSIELVYTLVQDVIIPLSAINILNSNRASLLKILFTNLIPETSILYTMVGTYIEKNDVDDEILTKLEYLATSILYSDNLTIKDKGYIFSSGNIGSLKIDASNILIIIFKHHPDQKRFVLNEILSYIDRLPTNKNLARQYKLSRGGNVQLITILLLQLIQSFDINQFSENADEIIQSIASMSPKEAIEQRRKSFFENCTKLMQQANLLSDEIAYFLTKKLMDNPEQQFKICFENLLEDLLLTFTFPEWPAAEILLNSLMKNLLKIMQSGNCTVVSETYALEMLGLIGSKILSLKLKYSSVSQLSLMSTESDINYYKTCFDDTLGYVQLQTHKSRTNVSSFRFLLLKYIGLISTPLLNSAAKEGDQLAVLNSDDSAAESTNMTKIEKLCDSLLVTVSEDAIKLNRALNSDKDLSSISYYISILLSQEFLSLYETFLATVIYSLESNKIKSKTRAIKILTSLIDKDPSLLISPKVQESVSRRLLDSSPLVRDAVIDLISQYMSSRPEVVEKFQRPITYRLNDDSIQVRKRVMKLSKDMYFKAEKRTVKSQIAARILRKLDDVDDGIRELAKTTLMDFWFTSLLSEIRGKEITSITSSVFKRCEVMMDVVTAGGNNSQYFELFLKETILSSKDTEISQSVKLYIDKILDFIIDCSDTEFQRQVEKALILITTFVRCDGKLLNQDQLVALQPYIIDRNSNETMYYYCLEILKYVLPFIKSLRPDFVEPVQSYLLRQLTKFNVIELHEAMPCIWRLCKMKNNTFKLANAAVSCIKLIKQFMELPKKEQDEKERDKLQRLLHLLGCFGTYCKFEESRDIFLKSSVGMKDNETILSVISKFLLLFCNQKFDASIRNVSLMNIIHVCGSHPKLFLSDPILKILDRELSGDNLTIKYTIVEGIMRFLQKEDRDSINRNGIEEKSSREIKLDISAFHGDDKLYLNDGISTCLAQRYINSILDLCLNDDDKYSLLSVKCLQIIVELGIANPKLCVPTIIALESSTNPNILRIASDIHSELYDKHESLTESSYAKGIRMAIGFRRRVSMNIFHERQFISNLYSIVRGNFSSRKKFIQSLINIFKLNTNNSNPESNKLQRDSIIFVSLNIASLNLATIEEVLMIIHGLDKLILREGMDLIDEIEDRTPDMEPLYIENLCINSQSALAIIVLRNHLVNTYCISSNQIDNFSPHRVDIELRQSPKLISILPVTLGLIDLEAYKKDGGEGIFSSLIEMMNELSH